MSEETLCAFCEVPVGGDHATIGEDDDPYDRFEGQPIVHDECLRRHRAAVDQTRRMFETLDKDHEAHTDIEGHPAEVDEDELDEEIDELEAELAGELTADDE
jgi:hypothetical protein